MRTDHKNRSRREFLETATKATCLALVVPAFHGSCGVENAASIAAKPDAFDEALSMMSEIAPLSNHGPMAAEALVELGREDRVIEFAKIYNRYYASSYPAKTQEITASNWKEAIGEKTRVADWVGFFEKQTAKSDWKTVVKEWVPRLAPGFSAAAAHGVIRTGHAIRSLERVETDVRQRELAEALGYWSAYFHKLPEKNDGISVQWPADGAIGTIPMIAQQRVSHTRSIMGKLEVVGEWDEFGSVINMLDMSRPPAELISNLTEAFARAYAKHVNKENCVSLIHSVTGTAMLRSIVPHLETGDVKNLIRYAWQTAAAIYSASGNETVNTVPTVTDLKPADLVKRAVASNEVHAIKFTEACLREYELNRKPVFLIAIEDALGRLGSIG